MLSLPVNNLFSFEFYDFIKMLIIFLSGYIYFNSVTISLDLAWSLSLIKLLLVCFSKVVDQVQTSFKKKKKKSNL